MTDRSEDIKKKLRQPTTKEEKGKILTAVKEGDLTTIQQLYTSGVDVTRVHEGGWTMLHQAVYNGSYDVVAALLTWGAEVDAVTKATKRTSLHWATIYNHPQMMSLLISHGANVNMKDRDGYTPLVNAVRNGSSSAAVYYLINEEGVDPAQCPQSLQEEMKELLKKGEESKQQGMFTKLVATTQKLGSTYPVVEIGSAMLNDANTTKGIPCPPDLQTELKESKSSIDFFAAMKNYPTHWNFLNVEVFKKLAGKDQEFIQSIDKYTDKLSRMKLNDIKFPVIAYDEKFYTPINVTVDVDPSSVTVGDLFKYQSQLAKFLSIDRSALILVKVSAGSLCLVFIVCSAVILFGLCNLRNASLYYRRHHGEVTFKMQLGSGSDTKDNVGAGASSNRISTAATPLSLPYHPINGHHGTCSDAFAKIKEQYDVLANCPVNKLLPSLCAKDVITLDDKKKMESQPQEKDRMMYLLDDVLIRSLKSDHSSKYNGFLKVLEESDDSSVTDLTRKLAPPIRY